MWHKRLISIPAILALMNSWLYASVLPGYWEKVEALEQGSTIVVTLDTGDILRGEFATLEEESILMIVDDQEREYPKEAITQISRLKLGWSRKKKAGVGALIGSAIGAAAGLGKQTSNETVIYEANP